MKSKIYIILITLGLSIWLFSQLKASNSGTSPNIITVGGKNSSTSNNKPEKDSSATGSPSNTFKVCDVTPSSTPLKEIPANTIIQTLLETQKNQYLTSEEASKTSIDPVVLCSSVEKDEQLINTHTHALVQAVYNAYADHRPLVLSPDMIWLLIAQGFSLHVTENAEDLRHLFVDHEGQINLDVKRGSYVPNSRPFWEGIFPDFSDAIAKNTKGNVKELVTASFSGTGIIEKAAFEITLMDAMSAYFTYSVSITCGIPNITVEGTPEDWADIEDRLEQLKAYDLDWWVDDLKPIIAEFKAASEGKAKTSFWEDIFTAQTQRIGCGSETFYRGWIFKFFPYLKNGRKADGTSAYSKNHLLISREANPENSPILELSSLPSGLAKAKVLLNNNGAMTMLYFNAGFAGIEQADETLALRPNIHWFVVDTRQKPTAAELAKYNGE
ncbi:MAG: DUF4419 domain-containing protein [Aureispira sp.]|nr:DUF4419 domain-containing protein [Aureispira sp.]